MSAPTVIFHRLRHTPLRDLLRGRLSARLDIAARIKAADLPAPAAELIIRVIRRTRLWRIEKADVADELIAHFADGLEAGRSIDELLVTFGDQKRAAKLIRRAKLRNRPLVWHAMIFTRRLALALIALYALLAIYYHSARPNPGVDYLAQLDQQVASTPPDQRAWPLYREAIRQAHLMPYKTADHDRIDQHVLRARPGKQDWPKLVQWLDRHADALEIARQAAQKPKLGVMLGPGGAWDDPVLYPPGFDRAKMKYRGQTPLLDAPQAHIVSLSWLADAMIADAYLARQRRNIDGMLRDIEAVHGIAEHLREHDLIVGWFYMPLELRGSTVRAAGLALGSAADAMSDEHLRRLAHLFAHPDAANELVSYDSERDLALDHIQRMYSDDGGGDGRLTPQGARMLDLQSTVPKQVRDASYYFNQRQQLLESFRSAVGPAFPFLIVSRREASDILNRLFDRAEANLAKPWWQADWKSLRAERMELRRSPASRLRFAPILSHLPWSYPHALAERYLGERDGLLIAIALELHRREHGRFPMTLGELSPALLPAVPVDRINGQPLHYRVVDDKPLIYSVGRDGDDDAGRPPLDSRNRPRPRDASPTEYQRESPVDGDWVLFPPIEP